jgi:hypothetical protein
MDNTWATNLFDDLKELIYPLEAPQRVRTVPMQVLAVGPARSGTDSLRAALVKLGYNHTYHGYDIALSPPDDKAWWKLYKRRWHSSSSHGGPGRQITASEFDTVIGHCAAITDFDAACFARDLLLAYPDAKVILNVRRDREAWFQSCQNTILKMKGDWKMWIRSFFCSELFWEQENFLRCLWPAFYRGDFRHTGQWVLEEHCALVRGTARSGNLLEWSPEDGWGPLCRFLEKPIPDQPFPRGNGSKEYTIRIEELHRPFKARADRNLMLTLGMIGLVFAPGSWVLRA